MSDSANGKKFVEENHLEYFLAVYNAISDNPLIATSSGESPDFICARSSGEFVGLDLARVPHEHELSIHDRNWAKRTMVFCDLFDAINRILLAKERKRQSPHWRTPNNTILVLELLNYTFDSYRWTEDSIRGDDYAQLGFVEIWLVDYSTLAPFGEVRVIGLYPSKYWGTHPQPALEGKPYG